MDTEKYYNAKPSKIANIGNDVYGAKRMNFDTYETDAEKVAKQKRKAVENGLNKIKEEIKAEVLKDSPDIAVLIGLLHKQFQTAHEVPSEDSYTSFITEQRKTANTKESIAAFNKMVRAYNTLNRSIRNLSSAYYSQRYIMQMRKRFESKKHFTEQSGKKFNWNGFDCIENQVSGKVDYLKTNSKAVQFGNALADKERGYILIQLSEFLDDWKSKDFLKNIDLKPVSWSFGARGKAGSVAYYDNSLKVISVNRNNIGSLIHEIGHYIDAVKGHVSRKISSATVKAYRDSIKDGLDYRSLTYYCKREEIFARAFEAYCYKTSAKFNVFAQCGNAYLPELNDELLNLLNETLAA